MLLTRTIPSVPLSVSYCGPRYELSAATLAPCLPVSAMLTAVMVINSGLWNCKSQLKPSFSKSPWS